MKAKSKETKNISESAITNQNAKEYLEKNLFGDVRIAMKQLLDHIQETGELEKYWSVVEKKNEDARRAARRLEKDRKRLEMGSDYESSGGEEDEDNDDYYSDEDVISTLFNYILQYTESEQEDDVIREELHESDTMGADISKISHHIDKELPFNAVRFIGMIQFEDKKCYGRPPDTPMLQFYSSGKYEKSIDVPKFRKQPALPGEAALLHQRNQRSTDSLNIKPITQSPYETINYNPSKYLKPYEEFSRSKSNLQNDVSVNSLSLNKIVTLKKSIETRKNTLSESGITVGNLISRLDFNSKKMDNDKLSNRKNEGKRVFERILYANKDEQEYFTNSKVFTNQSPSEMNYKRQIPDYFRILDDPRNQKSITDSKDFDGMVSIVSKNQGWITVTPKRQDRKKPLEKGGIGGDVTKTSILTPTWMQIPYPKNRYDPMKGTVEKFGIREEKNRTFLFDKVQPKKSIFNYQHARHNVHSKELTEEFSKKVDANDGFQRIMEWQESPTKASFERKPVHIKIGSFHA